MVIVVLFIYGEFVFVMLFVGGEYVYSMWVLGLVGLFVCMWVIIFGYISVVVFEVVVLLSVFVYIVFGFNVFEFWMVVG